MQHCSTTVRRSQSAQFRRCSQACHINGVGSTHRRVIPRALESLDALASRRQRIRDELLDAVSRLGIKGVLPGSDADKAKVDALVAQLKALAAGAGPAPEEQLLGSWALVYASNGTAVTRTDLAQGLIQASASLPGLGVQRIQQTLTRGAQGGITTTNQAEFGLGPLGAWSIAIEGGWRPTDGPAPAGIPPVQVTFERFKVKPVGFLGLRLPDWLPPLLLSSPPDTAARRGADWATTYLDDKLRVGEGSSGNVFVFVRAPPDA